MVIEENSKPENFILPASIRPRLTKRTWINKAIISSIKPRHKDAINPIIRNTTVDLPKKPKINNFFKKNLILWMTIAVNHIIVKLAIIKFYNELMFNSLNQETELSFKKSSILY